MPRRWERDRDAFTYYHQTFGEAYPRARRDPPVRAARRLHDLERAQDAYDAQRAFDDPLVMAEHRLSGQAFGGTVTECDPTRLDETGKRPKLRPLLRVGTHDPVRLDAGTTVCNAARPALKGRIVEIGDGSVLLELTGGMGRKLTPEPGAVPQEGDRVCFTSLTEGSFGAAKFPTARTRRGRTAGRPASTCRPTRTPKRNGRDRAGGPPPGAGGGGRPQPVRGGGARRGRRARRSRGGHRGVVVDSPPGAGKSTLVVRAAAHLAEAGERLMIVAQTNEQVDDLIERIAGKHPGITLVGCRRRDTRRPNASWPIRRCGSRRRPTTSPSTRS